MEEQFLPLLARKFRLRHHLEELTRLGEELHRAAESPRLESYRTELDQILDEILAAMVELANKHFGPLAVRQSEFFRDLAAADYMQMAEARSDPKGT